MALKAGAFRAIFLSTGQFRPRCLAPDRAAQGIRFPVRPRESKRSQTESR